MWQCLVILFINSGSSPSIARRTWLLRWWRMQVTCLIQITKVVVLQNMDNIIRKEWDVSHLWMEMETRSSFLLYTQKLRVDYWPGYRMYRDLEWEFWTEWGSIGGRAYIIFFRTVITEVSNFVWCSLLLDFWIVYLNTNHTFQGIPLWPKYYWTNWCLGAKMLTLVSSVV